MSNFFLTAFNSYPVVFVFVTIFGVVLLFFWIWVHGERPEDESSHKIEKAKHI